MPHQCGVVRYLVPGERERAAVVIGVDQQEQTLLHLRVYPYGPDDRLLTEDNQGPSYRWSVKSAASNSGLGWAKLLA